MSTKKTQQNNKTEEVNNVEFALPKKNIMYIIIAFAVMILGYVLMTGGGSEDPNVFNDQMFSFRRIVLAPVVIVGGMVGVIIAIMRVKK